MVEEGGGEEKGRRDGDRKGLNRREIVCGRCRDDIADWRQFSIDLERLVAAVIVVARV